MLVRLTYRMANQEVNSTLVVSAPDTCAAIISFIADTFPRGVRPVRIKAEVIRETVH